MVKEDKGDFLADSHSILNKWQNYFYQDVHRVRNASYIEINVWASITCPFPIECEVAIEMCKVVHHQISVKLH
jgi:hypothetical protein